MKLRHNLIIFIVLIVSFLFTCKKDIEELVTKDKLIGYVQKGPYLNGTTINIFELNESLIQTGKTFKTTIINNAGSFEINNLSLVSKYAELSALGYYFNEVTGKNSLSQYSLNAISDLSNKSTINVNVLTHLEKDRVTYLVGKGIAFNQAKDSAQNEILNIFDLDNLNIGNSETLDISESSEKNAILLAVSIIIQGERGVADMTELIANIITDIKEDGILNDENIKSKLYNSAKNLNLNEIRLNIEKRYSELGFSDTLPNFEKIVKFYLEAKKPFDIDVEVTDVSCFHSSNGSINITVNEGTAPYTYLWSNGATTEDISGIPAGKYSVKVIDANNYEISKNDIRVVQPTEILVTGDIDHAICETGGSINVTVSGGTPGYNHLWSNDSTGESITEVIEGIYSVTVSDSNGCTISEDFVVMNNSSNIEIEGVITNENANNKDGSIFISVEGEAPPFTYEWSNGETSIDLSNIQVGNYVLTIMDSNGCIDSSEFKVFNLISDIEGNEYKAVTIGNQIWMTENLKTKTFNDGTILPYIDNYEEWWGNSAAAFTWNNFDINYKEKQGAVYNWYAIETNKLCPIGWHIPTKSEWDELITFVGGREGIYKLLDSKDFCCSFKGNNETDFSAIPGGGLYADLTPQFVGTNEIALWWSITENTNNKAWAIWISDQLNRYYIDKKIGLSVRCIKDK